MALEGLQKGNIHAQIMVRNFWGIVPLKDPKGMCFKVCIGNLCKLPDVSKLSRQTVTIGTGFVLWRKNSLEFKYNTPATNTGL